LTRDILGIEEPKLLGEGEGLREINRWSFEHLMEGEQETGKGNEPQPLLQRHQLGCIPWQTFHGT